MKKTIVLLAFLSFSLSQVYSQIEEIKTVKLGEYKQIYNFGKYGLAWLTEIGDYTEFIFYDKNLSKNGSVKFKSERGSWHTISLFRYDTILESFVIIHGKDYKNKELVIIDGKSKDLKIIKLKFPKISHDRIFIKSLCIFGNKAFYKSSEEDNDVFTYGTLNMEDGMIGKLELPDDWSKRKIETIDKLNSKFLAITYINKKTKIKNIALMNKDGQIEVDKLIKEEIISPNYHFNLTNVGKNQILVDGLYFKEEKSSEPDGIFFAKIENLKQIFVKYYSFKEGMSYEKFRPSMTENDRKYYVFHILVHPVNIINGNYIIASEFCIPNIYNYNLSKYQNYLFTHNLFLTINETGEKEYSDWEKTNKPDRTHLDDKILSINLNNEEIHYTYLAEDKIYRIIYKDGNIDTDKPFIQIPDKHDTEKDITENYKFEKWYDNYYYGMLVQYPKYPRKLKPLEFIETTTILIKYQLK